MGYLRGEVQKNRLKPFHAIDKAIRQDRGVFQTNGDKI